MSLNNLLPEELREDMDTILTVIKDDVRVHEALKKVLSYGLMHYGDKLDGLIKLIPGGDILKPIIMQKVQEFIDVR